jgi:hypothetical protein
LLEGGTHTTDLLTATETTDLTMAPTTNMAYPTFTEETSESVEDIPMGQPWGEDDGPDSDDNGDDAFSQSSDLTTHANDPKYWGVRLLGQDKCRSLSQ